MALAAVAGPSSSPSTTPKSKDKKHKRSSSSSGSGSKKQKSSKKHHDSAVLSSPLSSPSAALSGSIASDAIVSSAFETMHPVLNFAIPPVWSPNPYAAFSDLMDTLVMRYVPQLSGVLITHRPLRFLHDTAKFYADNASPSAPVEFECIVWRPKIGHRLQGTITLSSPSHVSLLLYGTFNASIPASHLSQDSWEFVIDAEADLHVHGMGADRGLGHWRSKLDGSRLGGDDGTLSFTVISMTVANHILSLHGSLLDAPFSVPAPTQDASYLAKSLSDAKVLGFAAGKEGRAGAKRDDDARDSPKPPNRRVRWEDEDSDDNSHPLPPDATVKVTRIDSGHDHKNGNDGIDTNTDTKDPRSTNTTDALAPTAPPQPQTKKTKTPSSSSSSSSKRKSRKSPDSHGDGDGDDTAVDESGSAKSRDKKKRKKEKQKSA